ncbi:SDR family oxidoreductase [Streptomyces ipomoeae]|uniref:SDR family oxidoreductase n=1 Tax=Streptomyces ipomoeae TaxID=103232 RepID=UPI001C67A473
MPADLSDPQAAADLAHAAVEVFGRLDIVVNNVGGTHPRPLLETTTDFLEESFRFNVSGAHALTTAAVPFMLEAGGGAIVTISSLVGRVAGRGWAAYGTAKAALSHYTRLAALDLAPRIRVNTIEPGSVATSALDGVSTPEIIEKLESAIPLRRMGDPEHIVATVLYLVSPAGAYVTGKILEVDGGSQLPPADL